MEKKNIHKKSLAMSLIRCGHDLLRVKPNLQHPKYMIFVFKETPELIEDLLRITKQDRIKKQLEVKAV